MIAMKTTDVIIFCGQSNMQGQTEALSENERVTDAFEYKYLTDSLVELKNPVGENIRYDGGEGIVFDSIDLLPQWHVDHAFGSSSYSHTNLVPEFCRAYIEQTHSSVVAVHAAKGSTDIACWLPPSREHRMLIDKSASAIKRTKEEFAVRHVYFVWLQGESDAISSRSKAYYKDKLRELAAILQKELGVERFGIIRVGRFTCDARDDEIISAQDEICAEEPFFLMLTDVATQLNEQPEMMNPYALGHYSAKGLETLGRLSGETLGKNI